MVHYHNSLRLILWCERCWLDFCYLYWWIASCCKWCTCFWHVYCYYHIDVLVATLWIMWENGHMLVFQVLELYLCCFCRLKFFMLLSWCHGYMLLLFTITYFMLTGYWCYHFIRYKNMMPWYRWIYLVHVDGCMHDNIYILLIIHHLVDWPKCS